jgi:hypothetical protein
MKVAEPSVSAVAGATFRSKRPTRSVVALPPPPVVVFVSPLEAVGFSEESEQPMSRESQQIRMPTEEDEDEKSNLFIES